MKYLFLILITLIFFACTKDNTPSCEENNTCCIKFINNTEYCAQFAIWVWDEPSNFYLGDSSESHIDIDYVIKTEIMFFTESILVENVPTGYTVFIYSDTNDDEVFISQYIDKFKTENCQIYTIEIVP